MPRRKLTRRFEPRFGVNQAMLDEECKWVGQELQDYLIWSTNDLRKTISDRQISMKTVEAELRQSLDRLPDRERLAIRSMLARDLYHIAMLYRTFLHSSAEVQNTTGTACTVPEEMTANGESIASVPFTEWLFDH